MRAESGVRNPVVFAVIIHVVVLVAILAGVMTVARSLDRNLVLVILVTVAPATIIVIISLGSTIAVITQRARRRLVVSRNPGATVIPAEWSSAVLAPFVKETDASGSNYRGFGVEITADESGLGFWRSRTMNDVILIGRLPWSQIDAVEAGSVKAVIGRRVAPTIRIAVHPGSSSPFTEEIELLLRKVSVQRALAALRPGDR